MAGYCEWSQGIQWGKDIGCKNVFSPATFARVAYDYFEHFSPSRIISTTAYAGQTVTQTATGTLVMQDDAGGWLGYLGGADGNGVQTQSDGEAFLPAANKDIYFETSIKAEDGDDLDWFIGLAMTDADILNTDPNDLIAFRGADGSANITFQVRSGGTGAAADTGYDFGDGTAVTLGFHVRGITSVVPYVNGVALTAVTANIPTNEMSVSVAMYNGATAATQTMSVDYIKASQPI